LTFIFRDEEWCSSRSIRRFDFYQKLSTVGLERKNIVSRTIALLRRNPPYFLQKIEPLEFFEFLSFDL